MADTTTSNRPARIPLGIIIASAFFSLAVALFAAWFLVGRSADDSTVSPRDMVSGDANADVKVSGSAALGKPAPKADFTYLDGSTGSLADYRGKTVFVNFWSSTCAPCLQEMPALERIHQDAGDAVVILGVGVSDGLDAARKMVDRTDVTYPQARDPKAEILTAFGGTQLPHSVVIDPKGVVRGIHDGALDAAGIRELLGSK